MKKNLRIISLLLHTCITASAQNNDCGYNAGFENGTTAGWICKSGTYGDGCPVLSPPPCPAFGLNLNTLGCLNGGVNATLTGANNRHTIVTGSGLDPNSLSTVPVVSPGGGIYSFRLGNDNTGSLGGFSLAEGMRLTFNVNNQNAGFTYRFAVFLEDPGHDPEAQPRFEISVFDDRDSLIPCGYYKVVAGTGGSCPGTSGFLQGAGNYRYTNWTDVGLDLTGYIGQNVSIEFRTADCIPSGGGSTSLTCVNDTCTFCVNSDCCVYVLPDPPCTPVSTGCNYAPGTHSAYAYIDAYCRPLTIDAPSFCTSASTIQICAPPGYASYNWPSGQVGMIPPLNTQCVTIANPVAGTVYTVDLISVTGCPTTTTATLTGVDVLVNDTTICLGTPSITLNAVPAGPGSYTYAWTGCNSFSSTAQNPTITPAPTTDCIYSVTITDSSGCFSTRSMTVHVITCTTAPVANFTANDNTLCGDQCVNYTDMSTNATTWNWQFPGGVPSSSTQQSPQNICYPTTGNYTVTLIVGNGMTTDTLIITNYITVFPAPPTPNISQAGDILSVQTGYTTYQWYFQSVVIAGATNYNYQATQSGNYNIVVTDINGCTVGAGILNVIASLTPTLSKGEGVMIYPNPSDGNFFIKNVSEDLHLEIFDPIGRKVYSENLSGKKEYDIHPYLAAGVYILQFITDERAGEKKRVIYKLMIE